MSGPKVLIVGGGVAGPVLAFWLARINASVTVVERAPAPRPTGQNIDIRGPAVDIVERMGLLEEVKKHNTTEKGIMFVDGKGEVKARFDAGGEGANQSFTSEFEILRGDLAKILYNETKEKARYIFGETIKEIRQEGNTVHVDFANGTPPESFDLVVGADGQSSKTRTTAFPDEITEDVVKSLGQWIAFYAMPKGKHDDQFARWYNAPGRRLISMRPDNVGGTRAILAVISDDPKLDEAAKSGVEAQKRVIREVMAGAGWETERALQGMDQADDFYFQQVVQVKMDRWTEGRVTLLGDAGYAPSPISGMGTCLAISGAYVLAGEMAKNPDNIPLALENYDRNLRPFVESGQKLPPGGPALLNPETQTGIYILNGFLRVLSWTGVIGLIEYFSGQTQSYKLPKYSAFE
ncbi:MAG: hypothetical protein M1831_006719 [Alyxoria varia]|nr:MAG: hypothetical protein M1831_006719 [Alyxoria varia]